eukprot:GHUV01028000.1.p1 GENE.GHUV01028000.1~~GHUV01028000.1.p1  ORF type:complete len:125 (+),score=33.39 GHUV01028000.1:1025-1399(+)
MHDIPGFVDTRYRLLQLRSNNRNNWIAFAIAHHLDGNHELCVQILSAYESTLDEIPASEAYEHSELLSYKALVLAEGEQAGAALALLDKEQVRRRSQMTSTISTPYEGSPGREAPPVIEGWDSS